MTLTGMKNLKPHFKKKIKLQSNGISADHLGWKKEGWKLILALNYNATQRK